MKYKKIAPGLLSALEDLQAGGQGALTPHMHALGLVARVNSPKPARAIVFLYCDPKADFSALAATGIHVNQASGAVRTAFVPMDRLGELSDQSKIKRIVPARKLRPLMDVAPGKVKVPAFKSASGLTGDGVVIGIVDTGIDPNHPDFAGRILSIWDQTLSGPGVAEGGYGLELTGNLLTASRDSNGHGTHVAGIAAGTSTTYGGIAPKAQYVIVKTDFQNAHIADGVRYIFRTARNLGKPAVVNLSLGGHSDAHDGTDGLSQVIDSETGPGHIVCCAAGNEGNDNIHAEVALGAPATRTARFLIPSNSVGTATLNGWYPGTGALQVAVREPGGLMTPFQAVIATGSPVRTYSLAGAQIVVETPGPDPVSGDHNFWVQIRSASGGAAPGGIWQLRVKNTAALPGQMHVWTLDDQEAPTVVFTGTSATDSHKIGSPGAASSAITVAAYTTKDTWVDIDGASQHVGLALDTIAEFSSEGPLRNGAKKPDVTAPGAMIASCLSADSAPERSSIVDANHLVEAGTSMATPFMVGIVALLLERNPALTPTAAKALLKGASRIPGQPAGTFDTKWGFGLINALNL